MKKALIITSYILLAFTLSVPKESSPAKKNENSNLESSTIAQSFEKVDTEKERRVKTLEAFLDSYNSPLAPYAHVFVNEAYKNNLDWRLVAAISGVESTFGKNIPYNSYNGWGWANGKYQFESWEQAITLISETLNTKYAQKWGADTPYEIGPYYASSPTWASKVTFFMEKIEASKPEVSQVAFNL